LFWTALSMSVLSIATLGIYRFWMVTRLRRHYWSGIQIMGDPLEYTGRGIEKMLGFLLAIVFLAVYLGLINLGLTFIGFSYAGDDPVTANLLINLSVIATVPLIFFAQYRATRYMLSRTRWRGIRFGMEAASWGYMFRAILLSILTLVTLGLAYPYQQFKLAQYMTNRSWFGTIKFEQEGSWIELFASWIWIYIMLFFIALAVWTMRSADSASDGTSILLAVIISIISTVVLYLTFLRYRFHAFRVLWSNRKLGGSRFDSEFNTSEAVKIFITGSVAISLTSSMVFSIATIAMAVIFAGTLSGEDAPQLNLGTPSSGWDFILLMMEQWPVLLGFALTYLFVIALVFALSQVLFTNRLLHRKVSTLSISNARLLTLSQQRDKDNAVEAGGFADALGVDVGAGF
ncbi:MAG: DUF898 family protein, partial [Pseudomonadota bacterium]